MSGETMREAVARAIEDATRESQGRPPLTDTEWRVYWSPGGPSAYPSAFAMRADAAIRAVLDKLREPSEAVWMAGRDPILARDVGMSASMLVRQSWYNAERDPAPRQDGYITKGDCAVWVWRAMLDAAAREVG